MAYRGQDTPVRGRSAYDRPSALYGHRPVFAALDLGTNNCRLLIARPEGDELVVIDAYSRIVRLGEGVNASGRLSEAAMDRAIEALRVCADKLRRRRVVLARSVATEACRQAENGPEFIERVRRETGIALDIICAEEEARLAVMGCHQLLSPEDGPALVFDIGGGSTELVLLTGHGDNPTIIDWQSIPWGVVSLTEAERYDDKGEQSRLDAYAAMRGRIHDAFASFSDRLQSHVDMENTPLRLLGTSGTVTTLASVHLGLPSYDRSKIDGLTVEVDSFRDICARLASRSIPEREAMPCIGRERADLVVAGCAIFEEIIQLWPAAQLHVADRGIREGVLRQMMQAHYRKPLIKNRRSAA